MNVLVAYATRHGGTRGIAERIAERLTDVGLSAEVLDIHNVHDVDGYDAFVIGSAAYMFHWLRPATQFVKRHRDVLAQKPVWLFSSGPLGTDLVDEDGNDVLEVTRPKEFAQLPSLIGSRGERVFFGAWDPEAPPVGVVERVFVRGSADGSMPAGDFRDWPAIDVWAEQIAAELTGLEPNVPPSTTLP
jgi:menaquinone-dependent protoporphyrinogen oxidase